MQDPNENFKINHVLTDEQYQEIYEHLLKIGVPDLYAAYIAENTTEYSETLLEINAYQAYFGAFVRSESFSVEFNGLLSDELLDLLAISKKIQEEAPFSPVAPLTQADEKYQVVAPVQAEEALNASLGIAPKSKWHKFLDFFNKLFN